MLYVNTEYIGNKHPLKEVKHYISWGDAAKQALEAVERVQKGRKWHIGFAPDDTVFISRDGSMAMITYVGLNDENEKIIANDWAFRTVAFFESDPEIGWYFTDLRHYMPVEWAAREIKAAEERATQKLSELVKDHVANGVESGVAKAIEKGALTLEQIQTERKELEKRLTKLDEMERRERERQAAKEARKQGERSSAGYVYLIRALHDPTLYKIGCSTQPEKRKKTFDVKLPFAVEVECLIATEDMYALESELHIRFHGVRLDGEWFRLTTEDVEYIRKLATGH